MEDSVPEASKYPDVQDKTRQPEVVNENEAEVQSEPRDVTMELGDSNKITPPTGTVVLRSKVETHLEADYPVTSSPEAFVVHPSGGLANIVKKIMISYYLEGSFDPHT